MPGLRVPFSFLPLLLPTISRRFSGRFRLSNQTVRSDASSRHPTHPAAATVGQLKQTEYRPGSVKDELRRNVIRKLKAGEELFPGIVGYRESVVPQIVNGILSRHDLLFLGLRGQAKTRILRMLPDLLDEWMPVLSGVEINDDPIH